MQDFRHVELKKITETLREIDFSMPEAIPGMFEYRTRDENEKLEIQRDVTNEYKEGKLDPNKFVKASKKKKR